MRDTRRRFEEDVFIVINKWHLDPVKKETLYEYFENADFELTFNTYYSNKEKSYEFKIKVPPRPKFKIEPKDINIKRKLDSYSRFSRYFNNNKNVEDKPNYEMSLQQAWVLFNKNNM